MKNRRYEKIKSGLPREEKPKSGLEKSGKAKCPFAQSLLLVLWAAALWQFPTPGKREVVIG